MTAVARWLCLFLLLGAAPPGASQQQDPANGVLLVAKPELADPNFRETVVLVTQTADGGTVGVILNRPTRVPLRALLPGLDRHAGDGEPLYAGGPVMPNTVVAVFQSGVPPEAPAFHVLRDVYLSMHPENVRALLADPARRHRLFAGFAGWAPRQLQAELDRGGWYILPADADHVFLDDVGGLWEACVRRAQARPVGNLGRRGGK